MSEEWYAAIGKTTVILLAGSWGFIVYLFAMWLLLSRFRWLRSLLRIVRSLNHPPCQADKENLTGAAIHAVQSIKESKP